MGQQIETLVTSIYPPDEGGPSTFTESFGQFLLKNSFKVRVFTYAERFELGRLGKNMLISRISRNSPLILRLPFFSLVLLVCTPRKSRVLANGSFIECIPLLLFKNVQLVSKIPGDVVWERSVAKGRTSLNVFEFQEIELPRRDLIFRKLFLFVLRKSSSVIVPSSYLFDFCLRWGVDKEKIVLLQNTVDTKQFDSQNVKKTFDLIFVGRLVPVKKIEEIIKIALNNKLSLLIVGSGPLEKSLKSLSLKSDSEISFLGSVAQKDMPEIMNKAKVFVQNSLIEATSYALLEARSCGLIAVANELTGASEVIHHGHDGFLFGKKHNITLENAILQAVSLSEAEAKIFSSRAREDSIERFGRDQLYPMIQGLFQK
jgi:glycosyltransferase involved in cell wall biosynthesis